MIAIIGLLQGSIGIRCVIRQFLASQDLFVEWLKFLVEVQTEKNRNSTTKKAKKTEKTEGYCKFQIGTGFLGCNPLPLPLYYVSNLRFDIRSISVESIFKGF